MLLADLISDPEDFVDVQKDKYLGCSWSLRVFWAPITMVTYLQRLCFPKFGNPRKHEISHRITLQNTCVMCKENCVATSCEYLHECDRNLLHISVVSINPGHPKSSTALEKPSNCRFFPLVNPIKNLSRSPVTCVAAWQPSNEKLGHLTLVGLADGWKTLSSSNWLVIE